MFHYNPETGNASACKAKNGRCPFGGEHEHYPSLEAARASFEKTMPASLGGLRKPAPPAGSKPVILEVVHGSHLYGLATPTSDLDTYRVVNESIAYKHNTRKGVKQKITGDDDIITVPVSTFLHQCEEGTPQALEAMFSPLTGDPFDAYRAAYRLNTARFASVYRRTSLNFARLSLEDERAMALLAPTGEGAEHKISSRELESASLIKPRRVTRNGALKYRRHAVRLLLNRQEGIERGRFNPKLDEEQIDTIHRITALGDLRYATFMKSQLDWL